MFERSSDSRWPDLKGIACTVQRFAEKTDPCYTRVEGPTLETRCRSSGVWLQTRMRFSRPQPHVQAVSLVCSVHHSPFDPAETMRSCVSSCILAPHASSCATSLPFISGLVLVRMFTPYAPDPLTNVPLLVLLRGFPVHVVVRTQLFLNLRRSSSFKLGAPVGNQPARRLFRHGKVHVGDCLQYILWCLLRTCLRHR